VLSAIPIDDGTRNLIAKAKINPRAISAKNPLISPGMKAELIFAVS